MGLLSGGKMWSEAGADWFWFWSMLPIPKLALNGALLPPLSIGEFAVTDAKFVLVVEVKKCGSEIGPARILGLTGCSVPDAYFRSELFF